MSHTFRKLITTEKLHFDPSVNLMERNSSAMAPETR